MVNDIHDEGKGRDLGILMALAYGAFVAELRADMAAAGYAELDRSFGYVVRQLADGPLTLRELADRLGITPPGALKIVDGMEADGYLERTPDPDDGRAKRLRLTRRGRAALARARDFHRRFEARLAQELGRGKAAAFRAVLEAIVRAGGEAVTLRPM